MFLLYGVLCLCFTALLFAVTLLGARNPVRPSWAGEGMVANVLTPLILGFLVMGIAYCSKAFMEDALPGFLEWGCAGLSGVVAVALIMMLKVRKKLAMYDAEEKKRGELIQFDFEANRSPETPLNDKPDFRRAA